jgi:hypothetical protein
MRGASGDECGNLVLGQEYNRPAEAGVLKKHRGSDFNFNFNPGVHKVTIPVGRNMKDIVRNTQQHLRVI